MNIIPESEYDRVHTGSIITVRHLKKILEENDIPSIIRDDGESAIRGGFGAIHGDYALLFAHKKHLIKAKHLIASSLENFDEHSVSEQELERLSVSDTSEEAEKNRKLTSKNSPKRSTGNLLLNLGIIIYSLWRLYPLTQGEQLPTWRIVLSGSLILICGIALVNHFRKR